jgi:cyclopropane-fatty-acyl-phospholipid synthase
MRWYEVDTSASHRGLGAWPRGTSRIDQARQQKKLLAETATAVGPRKALPCAAPADALPSARSPSPSWDGTGAGDGPRARFTVRSPRAVACALRPGPARARQAYVSGELEVDDIDDDRPPADLEAAASTRRQGAFSRAGRGAPMGLERPPARPIRAVPRGAGTRSRATRRSVRHRYDLPAEFFALFLDESMTYSCAIFSRGRRRSRRPRAKPRWCAPSSASSPATPARRRLRVGQLAAHGGQPRRPSRASRCRAQARRARARRSRLGVADRVDIRVQDWRELAVER